MTLHLHIVETIKFEPLHKKCKKYFMSLHEAGSKYGSKLICEGGRPDFSLSPFRIKITSQKLDCILHLSEEYNGEAKQIAYMRIPISCLPINKRARVKLTLFNFGMKNDPEFLVEFHLDTLGAKPFKAEKGIINARIFELSIEKQNKSYEKYLATRKVNKTMTRSQSHSKALQKPKQPKIKREKTFEEEFGIYSSDDDDDDEANNTKKKELNETQQQNTMLELPTLPAFRPLAPGYSAPPPPIFTPPAFTPPKRKLIPQIPETPFELRSLDPEQPRMAPAPHLDTGIPNRNTSIFKNIPKNDYIQIDEPEESESSGSIEIPKELPEFQPTQSLFDEQHQFGNDPFRPPSFQPPSIPLLQPPKYDIIHHENTEIKVPRKLPSYDVLLVDGPQFSRFVQQK